MFSERGSADLPTKARKCVVRAVKSRARLLARRPTTLDLLHPGLGQAGPARLVAVGQVLLERESMPRRFIGFGGEVGLVNARAVLLLGRTLRRRAAAGGLPPIL